MTKAWSVHIVDDDEAVRSAYVFALEMAGFRPIAYVDANDFLARGRSKRGILLSDVRMPGIDGTELVQHLRKENPDIPIILMTGHASADLLEKMNASSVLLMIKPIDLDLLVAEIERLTMGW